MSYIAEQDLLDELGEERLIQLTDDSGAGEIDHAKVGKAISFAVGTFDSYARTRYSIPVPTTEKVKSVCIDLAVFKLSIRRAKTPEVGESLRKNLYDPQIKFLEALQGGKAALDVPAQEETAANPAQPDRILSGTSRPQFTDEKLRGY